MWLEELVEQQREWPHEAEARVALVVHVLHAPAAPRRSQRRCWPWGRGYCNRITCDAPLTRERARSPRLCGRQHPAALGETARSPGAAPCPTPTVVVAGSGAGVSGCCGGGASSLGETTVYSPSSKSPLRPYARCPMQRAIFLTFVARGWSTPQSTLREDGHSGRLAAANGTRYRWPPQTPAVAGLRRQTAGLRPPGAPQR